jgi:hypothetical protein
VPKLYVLADVYAWSTPIAGRPDRVDHHVARKGELIDVSDDEAARGLALAAEGNGGLSTDAADAAGAIAASAEPPSWSDEQLASANVDDTVAYLTQHPSEAARVLDAESARTDRKPRKTVLEAAERVQTTYEEELAAQAEQREADVDAEQRAYASTAGASTAAPRIPGAGS